MNALKPLISELIKLVKKGANLAKDELPEIANQIIRFYFWASVLWVAFGLGMVVVGLVFLKCGLSRPEADDTGAVIFYILSAFSALPGIIVIISNAIDILQLQLAPRLFLLNYLKSFLSSGSDNE